ncbi:HEAT repeat domain-containing protein [Singulisphaera sp. PoT]|uniref:HEAT repeat domain-containing protein n=1 Tax=Singulisphaera sp. PoT TaxID=3411797 RepID=UPI003BF55D92
MPKTDNPAEGMGRLMAVLTVIALAALGARIYKVEVLDKDPLRVLANEPLDELIAKIDKGDAEQRALAIGRLSSHGKVDLARVFPPLVRALGDGSEPLRYAAAGAIGRQISGSDSLSTRFGHVDPAVAAICREAGEALEELLDDPSARVRAAAAQSLGIAASRGRLEEPPPGLIACLEDEDRQVRIEAAGAAAMFVDGPAQFLPIALRHIPVEPFEVRNAFFNAVSLVRFEAPSLPTLIEGLSSDDAWVCMACTDAIDRMGRDASNSLPALLALIRRELKSPRQGDFDAGAAVLGPAIDAVGDVTPASGPQTDEAVALLREILDDANPPGSSRGTGPGGLTPEARLERRRDGAARAAGEDRPGRLGGAAEAPRVARVEAEGLGGGPGATGRGPLRDRPGHARAGSRGRPARRGVEGRARAREDRDRAGPPRARPRGRADPPGPQGAGPRQQELVGAPSPARSPDHLRTPLRRRVRAGRARGLDLDHAPLAIAAQMTATLLPPAWFDSIWRWASLLIPALFAARIASDHRPRLEGKAEGEVTAGARPRITTAMIMVSSR